MRAAGWEDLAARDVDQIVKRVAAVEFGVFVQVHNGAGTVLIESCAKALKEIHSFVVPILFEGVVLDVFSPVHAILYHGINITPFRGHGNTNMPSLTHNAENDAMCRY
ncbi:MAG: hypothetical protein AB7J13_01195 [Pyrinomonadaceae bacterium]